MWPGTCAGTEEDGRMKTGIATVSISGNLEEKIEAIAAAGFDGIEIFEQDFIADSRSPRDVGERIRAAGLELMLFQPFRDFEGLPGPLRAKAFDRAERKFDPPECQEPPRVTRREPDAGPSGLVRAPPG